MIFHIVGVRVGFLLGNNIIVSLTLRRVRKKKKKTVFEIYFYWLKKIDNNKLTLLQFLTPKINSNSS